MLAMHSPTDRRYLNILRRAQQRHLGPRITGVTDDTALRWAKAQTDEVLLLQREVGPALIRWLRSG